MDLVGNYSLMEPFCYQMEFFLRSDFKTAEVVEKTFKARRKRLEHERSVEHA